ncbi:MAG: tetratricopeptide repeat protein [Phycisphaeraceae bacterium]|nr:tetratricopeptide repeat protein [Phycisphaeraceae bacterium]
MPALLAGLMVSQMSCASGSGKKNKPVQLRKSLTQAEADQLHEDVEVLQKLVDARKKSAVARNIKAMTASYPQIAQYELKDFIKAEKLLLKKKFSRAAKVYQKVLEDYPASELRTPTVERLYGIGTMYVVEGRKKKLLWLFWISGYETGIKVLEVVSEAKGLEDPNGLGLKSALHVVDNYEKRRLYEDAYLKWLEISTVWEEGQLGRQALLGMADNKHASYNKNPVERRHLFDASGLKTAKTYYDKYLMLFPDDPAESYVTTQIQEIDEQIAYKEFSIGQFYERTGQKQAANLYYDMVIESWPGSQAAQMARETLNQPSN